MALTRNFKETILARAQRDARFRETLFTEAINAYLTGDATTGKNKNRNKSGGIAPHSKKGERYKRS